MSESSALQSFLKDNKPEHFAAKPGENAKDWLTKVDRYFGLLKLTPQDRAEGVHMLLDGIAEKWANNLPKAPEDVDPWQYFGKQFLQRFQNQNTAFFARQKLHQLKQFNSIIKYNSQFDTLRSDLDDLGEAEAIHYYIRGLKPMLREHFKENPTLCTDVATVIQIAESLEDFYNQFPGTPSQAKNPNPSNSP